MRALVEAATAGLARRPGPHATGWPVDGLAVLRDAPAESRFLLLAGAAEVYRIAGALPARAAPIPPAAADPRPPCSPAVADLLQEYLESHEPALLVEALGRLDAVGRRLPHGLLPRFLEAPNARRVAGLRSALGVRGRWLAGLRPDWSWALDPEGTAEEPGEGVPPGTDATAEREFQEGTPERRLAVLRSARRTRPEVARGWVEGAWSTEKVDVRLAFLDAVATGLGSRDEAFLETCLDDRAATVRAAAARLLARIPGSALLRRMTDRADAMLAWEAPAKKGIGGLLRSAFGSAPKRKLLVTPPSTGDRGWERDGIGSRPPEWFGERAHRLARVLSHVPPAHWEGRLGVPPAEIVPLFWGTDWGLALVLGTAEAAILHGAPHWAGPLVDALAAAPKDTPPFPVEETLKSLVALMPEADRSPRALRAVEGPDRLGMLRFLPVPWAPEVALRYLEGVRPEVIGTTRPDRLAPLLHEAARAFPPATLPSALEWVERTGQGSDGPARYWFDLFEKTVRLRHRIHQEIRP